MSLNPIQFGKDVIDQYGRYLLTTFGLADPELHHQLEVGLRFGPGGQQRLAKGPYIHLSRPFVQGPGIQDLIGDPEVRLHPVLKDLFAFDTLHKHQERTLRSAVAGRHVIVATGTGSGKTEAFLLPILDHCLKLRDQDAPPGVTALLIYPMNALVNDQLDRLRPLLAGSGITFGRYTGDTPESDRPVSQLEHSRPYTAKELEEAKGRLRDLPLPWEECYSRADIRARQPRLLLTNYSQLEYLLLRDKDVDLFRGAPLRFFVLDEVHTYTGGLGSEVACLLRRLRTVAERGHDDIVVIASSATVTDRDAGGAADADLKGFASRLAGVDPDHVDLVKEEYARFTYDQGERYLPPAPRDVWSLLDEILAAVRGAILADEVTEVSEDVIRLAERLCGRGAPKAGSTLERLHGLIRPNRVVETLVESFTRPSTLEELEPRLRALSGRADLSKEALQAELLAYLTLGALARVEDEPLMRPKLHYFLQGLHGLWLEFGWEAGGLVRHVHFSGHPEDDELRLPLSICRSCGQHYVLAAALPSVAVDADGGTQGVQALEPVEDRPDLEAGDGRTHFYLTDALVGGGGEEGARAAAQTWLCVHCGALHDGPGDRCLRSKCARKGERVPLLRFEYPVIVCPACDARGSERSPVITRVGSREVYDVMVLAQTALASMPEKDLRKLLMFADSRQDAAFQAGWMESRSLRFRVRHLLYRTLAADPERWWYFDELKDRIVDDATAEGMLPARGQDREPEIRRLTWLLLEEFFTATERQRRNSLEQLGLATLRYEGLHTADARAFASEWTHALGASVEGILSTMHLVLDVFRLKHAVNHPLLQRRWSDFDREVRDGTISVPEYYRPQVVFENAPAEGAPKTFGVGYRSRRGDQSSAERVISGAFPQADREVRSRFIDDLWAFMQRTDLMVSAQLKQKRQGAVQAVTGLSGARQLNLSLLQVRYAEDRYVCGRCGTARVVASPSGRCPSYNCQGTVARRPRDEEHYDVVQYTRMEFVPLLAREHSAQVPPEDRIKAEREFKEVGGGVNCLVATPTLELGVDIGPLEIVLMRNVPPSPANYAQRSGRAGRRHRIGVVFSYCRDTQHDQYFYRSPAEMISGHVRIPGFSMRNEPLVRKHVHSAVVTELRRDEGSTDVLGDAFPAFISSYFAEDAEPGDRPRLRLQPRRFPGLEEILSNEAPRLETHLGNVFTANWPAEDAATVSPEVLATLLGSTHSDLEAAVRSLFAEIAAYQRILREFRRIEDKGERLKPEEVRRRRAYEAALNRLWSRNQENYSISYLARRGYFPGYALVRDSVRAFSAEPYLELHRPNSVAIRELTPAARLYANRQQFRVRRLDFYQLEARQPGFNPLNLVENMVWDRAHQRVVTSMEGMEGGEEPGIPFSSLRLVDVELEPLGHISDQQEYRVMVGYHVLASLLPEHRGGEAGQVGTVAFRRLEDARLRLVNLGPRSSRTTAPDGVGFPICTVCGEARSPFASEAEIENFTAGHEDLCGRSIDWVALHADIRSELLLLGPFQEDTAAINAVVALQLGIRMVLETGDQDLEVLTLKQGDDRDIGVIFDPMPGGSGLLPLLREHWGEIIDAAAEALRGCDCQAACYRCLLNFRNQQHHGSLNRHVALNALGDIRGSFKAEHVIPPTFTDQPLDPDDADSTAEEWFTTLLKSKNFPLYDQAQLRVDLPGGSFTVADFAFTGQKVLVFIDGLSGAIHGNPEQKRKDMVARAKARQQGWFVVESSAMALKDKTMAAGFLDELGVYLMN